MKTVVVVLMDALCYENFSSNHYRDTPMPFLNRLAKEGITCTNMYSLGPYTEAALASCICGEKTLDHRGYMRGIQDCPQTLHEVFQRCGYKTLATYSPYIYSESYIRGIDQFVYNRFYDFKIMLDYRLEHFRNKYVEHCITENELELCLDLLKEGIRTWNEQLLDIKNKNESTILIRDAICSNEIEHMFDSLKKEYQKIMDRGIGYVKDFFELWDQSLLVQLSNHVLYDQKNRFYIPGIETQYYERYKKIQEKQNTLLKQNMPICIHYCLNTARNHERGIRTIPNLIKSYKKRYSDTALWDTINGETCRTKVTVSAKRQLDYFSEKIIENVQNHISSYTFIHLEDFHAPGMFFSYDIEDPETRRKELEAGIKYAEKLPSGYRGNLLADLSAVYLDHCLEEFVTGLQSIEDISFAFFADHGFAFNYNPPRVYNDTTFYKESYHIPFILWGQQEYKKQVDELFSSRDIVKSILTYAGLEAQQYRDLKVVWQEQGREYVLVEYCGPGCPDYSTSSLHYAVIDRKYIIGMKAKLSEDITPDSIDKIFDLSRDEFLEKNLKRKMKNNGSITFYLDKVKKRHEILRRNRALWNKQE